MPRSPRQNRSAAGGRGSRYHGANTGQRALARLDVAGQGRSSAPQPDPGGGGAGRGSGGPPPNPPRLPHQFKDRPILAGQVRAIHRMLHEIEEHARAGTPGDQAYAGIHAAVLREEIGHVLDDMRQQRTGRSRRGSRGSRKGPGRNSGPWAQARIDRDGKP